MLDSTAILDLREKHQAFFNSHKTEGVLKRIQYLKKLKKAISAKEEAIQEALYKDLKKSAFESFTSEILMVYKELDVLIKNTKEWAAPVRVSGNLINFPSQDYLLKEPFGSVLILAPWNYPFQLALLPILGAIAAGNTVVLKPSEFAPHTSKVLCELLESVFLSDWVAVVEGDAEVAQRLLCVQWDYIFFTGSTHVGRIVAQAAAQFLTPYTLELGGKSPCIVDGTTPLQKTAKRIVWG
ncbi:MAG: aldehyde dehydrogenase family protein, partial [Flavobacteriaceae bacterium]